MQLNRSTDIALRVLMYVAAKDGRRTIDELADALAVPRHHLAKVVQRLQRLGLLATVRGRGGGVELAPTALRTGVGSVVRKLEPADEVVQCDEPPCPLRGQCKLRAAFRRAHEAFLRSLDEMSLADLVNEGNGPVLLTIGWSPGEPGAR
ncbi:Rrf2 family transcriptional regulator [Saccharomonospora xinjiangensis]|uniref:RrF2 family transcriptional regulator n=1 Tax=Saccharomonospora xinjiangensis TaxID=75294 RepID=UPI00106FCE89|nr:Rrf2 family transcriptional regulator [Saccharomonospora xinjiangensis]QBQ62111.1 HTH-type transcriptional repressor NsrR [Saccharomonospora xinjiangensis]